MATKTFNGADPTYWKEDFDNSLVMPVYGSLVDQGMNDPTLTEDETLDTASLTWAELEADPDKEFIVSLAGDVLREEIVINDDLPTAGFSDE